MAAMMQNVIHVVSPLADDPVATATHALDDDGFAAFARIHRAGDASGQRTGNGASQDISVIVEFAEQGTGASAHDRCASGFLIELPLVAGQGLAGGEVALVRGPEGVPSRMGL